MMLGENKKYKYKNEAAAVVNQAGNYYNDAERCIQLQIDLIRAHLPEMDEETRLCAASSLKWLRKALRGQVPYGGVKIKRKVGRVTRGASPE